MSTGLFKHFFQIFTRTTLDKGMHSKFSFTSFNSIVLILKLIHLTIKFLDKNIICA